MVSTMKAKQDEQKMLITRGEFQLKAVESARNVQDKGFNGQDVSLLIVYLCNRYTT